MNEAHPPTPLDAPLERAQGPARARLHFERGMWHYERRYFAAARADFAAFVAEWPEDASGLNMLGCACLQLGEAEAGLAAFDRAVASDPGNAEARFNRGTVRQLRGDLEGALEDLDAALQLDPRMAHAFSRRSIVRHQRGEYEASLADANAALRLAPGTAEFHHNRGVAHLGLGHLRSALADFEAALQFAPDHCLALLGRANARYHLRDPQAVEDYVRAFALDAVAVPRTLVRILRNDLDRNRDAVFADCARHLAHDPHDVPALGRRGLSHVIEGNDDEARADFDALFRHVPQMRPLIESILQVIGDE